VLVECNTHDNKCTMKAGLHLQKIMIQSIPCLLDESLLWGSSQPEFCFKIADAAPLILLYPSVQNTGDHPNRNSATDPVANDDNDAGNSDNMNRRGIVRELPKAQAV
jgi:hypothetical protein